MNVKTRAEAVGTFRHVNVFLMECLAAWVPSTPEMEAKVLFGRHLWLAAQCADRLGKRARELRAPLHYSRPPAPGYALALSSLAALGPTAARLGGLYQVALPSLRAAYERYLAQTDPMIDEPTVVILEDALRDIDRMRAECERHLAQFPSQRDAAATGLAELRLAFGQAPDVLDAARESQTA